MYKDDISNSIQNPISNLENCSTRLVHVGIKITSLDTDDYFESELDFDEEATYLDKQIPSKK